MSAFIRAAANCRKRGKETMDRDRLYLSPVDGRQSFYNKCYVQREGKALCLYSYNTKVASIIGEKVVRHWNEYSATTMRHINAFVAHYGVEGGGKAWWCALPVVRM